MLLLPGFRLSREPHVAQRHPAVLRGGPMDLTAQCLMGLLVDIVYS